MYVCGQSFHSFFARELLYVKLQGESSKVRICLDHVMDGLKFLSVRACLKFFLYISYILTRQLELQILKYT